MRYNFEIITALISRAYYKAQDESYTLADVLEVFHYYLAKYESVMKRAHPNIRLEQIEKIIVAMPYIGNDPYDRELYFEPDAYPAMIDKHFQTKYNTGRGGCDYNINHFFSGDIRYLRFMEECYYERC